MIFNIWRPYPLIKPKEDGIYLCTLKDGSVLDLYYTEWTNKWVDKRRQGVFDGYKVYKSGRATIDENRVYSDGYSYCTADVVAWKKMTKPFGWCWKGEIDVWYYMGVIYHVLFNNRMDYL